MNKIPKHVAIIMDGNGRWGLINRKNRIFGHKAGIDNIHNIIDICIQKKIKFLTLYSFSIDNWKRNKKETSNIFKLFENFYKKNYDNLIKKKILIKIIGENKFLPKKILSIKKKINYNKIKNFILKINVAFNYSSKLEILNAIKNTKKKSIKSIDKKLYTYPDPYPDIIIRTGDRNRLSDFLLWQGSYSEIFFSKKLWPNFNKKDFNKILKKFEKIERNFGAA